MSIYKWEKCPACLTKRRVSKPTVPRPCSKCGGKTQYSENWYISYTYNGKEVSQVVGQSRKLAEAALAKQKTAIREGKFFSKRADLEWQEAVCKFATWYRANTSRNTQLMYDNCIKQLTEHFGHCTLRQITPEMIEAYKALRSETVTNSTINRDIATIKRLYALICDEWYLMDYNPTRAVKKLKENPSRVRFLTEEEKRRLLDACRKSESQWLYMGVLIALNTGMRKEAITSLKFAEIDFASRFIRATTKGEKITQVPINDALYVELLKYCEERKKEPIASPYLFPSPNSSLKPIRPDIHISFDRACRAAGISDFRFHDLRHTFARDFYRKTKDWKALSQILGHSDVSITMKVYVNFTEDDLAEAMQRFIEY